MLIGSDIIAAKLLVQMGEVDLGMLRNELHLGDSDPDTSVDLVARLAQKGLLESPKVKKIRRYVALFEHVRHEAVYLRQLERRQSLPKEEVSELIARLELGAYRRRLGAVLVEMERLSEEDAAVLDRITRKRVRAEDRKVLDRYRAEGFEGVGRPLIRQTIDLSVFRVSVLFRSRETQARVDKALLRLSEEEARKDAQYEFVPGDEESGESTAIMDIGDDYESGTSSGEGAIETHRYRPLAEPPSDVGLENRKRIGPYSVMEVLGQGGMGAVYLAVDELGAAMVAVKVMLHHKAKPDDVARFEREAKVSALVDHPNCVHLIDEGETEDGLRYMAIPFYAGKSLKKVLEESGGRLEPADAFHFFEQVLEALQACHEAGVVHRDLKPENVFALAGSERGVRLVDFGIARLMDDHEPVEDRAFRTQAGVISGSPAYIAPETITDDVYDGRTDIYSMGVMLFEMLTGRVPLFAETPYDYLREHLVGIPLTLFQGRKDAYWSPELEQLMASMLAKEKEDRPESCQVILDQLRGGLREKVLAEYANPPAEDEEVESKSLFNSFFKILKG